MNAKSKLCELNNKIAGYICANSPYSNPTTSGSVEQIYIMNPLELAARNIDSRN